MDDNVMSKEKKGRSRRGRQRIEIKKIEEESKRQVTFSKRRKGLFKKAKDLSTLCGVQVGILTVSKFGRVYTTHDIDALLETHPSFKDLLQKPVEEEEEAKGKLMEYREALMELREKAAVRLEELSNSIQHSSCLWPWGMGFVDVAHQHVTHLMTEQGIYEWCL
ncbi:hypothetical protein V6N13_073196 [Hibiscus sabdariffa]|uniref:MADS-box domain-containing protein n=1 Tax=Hibiscus sabdariffa TaxID=183260 RepID=A0ABR2E8G2_9ROSI